MPHCAGFDNKRRELKNMKIKILAKALPAIKGGYFAAVLENGIVKVMSIKKFRDRNIASNIANNLKKEMQA